MPAMLLAAAACGGAPETGVDEANLQSSDLLKYLDSLGNDAKTFRALLAHTGVEKDLIDPNLSVTLFLPPDDQLRDYVDANSWLLEDHSRELLGEILLYHLLPKSLASTNLAEGVLDSSLPGARLFVTDRQNRLADELGNASYIIQADVAVGSSYIHFVDEPLLPARNLINVLENLGYKRFSKALLVSGLIDEIRASGRPVTVFAVNDDDFNIDVDATPKSKLRRKLTPHVALERTFLKQLTAQTIVNFDRTPLAVVEGDGVLAISSGESELHKLTMWDVPALDAVIYEVNRPFLP